MPLLQRLKCRQPLVPAPHAAQPSAALLAAEAAKVCHGSYEPLEIHRLLPQEGCVRTAPGTGRPAERDLPSAPGKVSAGPVAAFALKHRGRGAGGRIQRDGPSCYSKLPGGTIKRK